MNPNQRLMRSRSERMLTGVSGGLAQYFAVDPVIIRLIFVVLAFSGIGLLLYPVLWLLMPKEPAVVDPFAPHDTVFVAPGSRVRQPRFDPMTGEPFDPEQEIPVENLRPDKQVPDEDVQMRRNRTLGLILLAVGLFFILKALPLGWLAPFLLPALLIGAGVFLLRRAA
jgi:phage shock protein C